MGQVLGLVAHPVIHRSVYLNGKLSTGLKKPPLHFLILAVLSPLLAPCLGSLPPPAPFVRHRASTVFMLYACAQLCSHAGTCGANTTCAHGTGTWRAYESTLVGKFYFTPTVPPESL